MDFDSQARFQTHKNYVLCLRKNLKNAGATLGKPLPKKELSPDCKRTLKLFTLTDRSIENDLANSSGTPEFSRVTTPWIPVKTYYGLYYLESVLCYLIDGYDGGFKQGGHRNIRKKMRDHIEMKRVVFSNSELEKILTVHEAQIIPALHPGKNATLDFWEGRECMPSLTKKLSDYAASEAKRNKKWNLRKPADRELAKKFALSEKVSPIDFFYWYRMKANYRDMDYLDFENDFSDQSILSYLRPYVHAYSLYRDMLRNLIEELT